MKRKTNQQVAALTNRTTFRVRFSEIDSMQIVWHASMCATLKMEEKLLANSMVWII